MGILPRIKNYKNCTGSYVESSENGMEVDVDDLSASFASDGNNATISFDGQIVISPLYPKE
jgi:hypothetical protein